MKHIFVVNPAAGKGKNLPAMLSAITYACEELEVKYEIYHTKTIGDGTKFVSEKCKAFPNTKMRFYACGGDGTLFEVLNGAVGYDNAEITVIPAGTGNDFIKTFQNPEYFSDVKRQILGIAEQMDLLKYNNKYSLNIVNIGFDCDVVQKVSEIKRKSLVPSKLAYIMGIADTFTKPLGKNFKVLIDDNELIEKDFMLCAMANALYYGNGFKAAPLAKVNDGYMDLCLVDRVSRSKFIKIISKYKAGLHVDENRNSKYPFLRYQKCKKVVIESKEIIGVCGDGEISPIRKVVIEIVPKAISFSIPKGSVCNALQDKNS
ncbi:MAG: YegS/Rv2252/BmrU family lipid kinase [Clostridia bacterium]|nr:YegS/Rv2252/BmrU family lipid kinase [Clostridia bacterium]